MSSERNERRGKLRTDGIFRRALGERDPISETERRTEPTLADPPPVSPLAASAAGAATPPPDAARQDDEAHAPAARARPLNFLRWGVVSLLTLTVSAAIGLALLLAPGVTPKRIDASTTRAWLSGRAGDAAARLSGRPAAPAPAADPTGSQRRPDLPALPEPPAAPGHSPRAAVPDPGAAGSTGMPAAAAGNGGGTDPRNADADTATSVPAIGAAANTAAAATAAPAAPNPATVNAAAAATGARMSRAPASHRAESGTAKTPVKATVAPAVRGDERAIRSAPAHSVFIQHAALGTRADALAWRARHRSLARAKVIAVNTRNQGLKYAVVSGPFTTRKQAEAFAARDGAASTPWYRTQPALRAALPAERR